MTKIKSYIITGPTASGKSDFAHKLAARIGGVVINADSVQIYQGIENIAASPFAKYEIRNTKYEIDNIPYRLFSILPLAEQISVADYLELARREYDAAIAAGKPVIFVGGTGFYINALLHGISPMPDVSPESRRRAREMIAVKNDTGLDAQRAARALEIKLETGRDISEFQKMPRVGRISNQKSAIISILINPPPDILGARIAARIPQMLDCGRPAGALAKVGALDEATDAAAGRAIGAASLMKFKRGEISRDEAINEWITKTNQYAKRQRTWFRTQFTPDIVIPRVPTDEDIDLILNLEK
jgi:tRNA dimethylallyltransferase